MLGSEISLLKTLPLTSDAYACGTWTIEWSLQLATMSH